MSDFDDIMLDGSGGKFSPKPTPQPQHEAPPHAWPQQVVRQPTESRGVPGWLAGLLAFAAVTFLMLWLSTFTVGPRPRPGPNPDPVDGAYAAIFYDDDEKGGYTAEQVTAIDSAIIAQFLDDNLTGWKKIDVDQLDELKNLNPIYAELAAEHRSKLPWVTVRSGRKLGSALVENPDQLLDVVKRTIK